MRRDQNMITAKIFDTVPGLNRPQKAAMAAHVNEFILANSFSVIMFIIKMKVKNVFRKRHNKR